MVIANFATRLTSKRDSDIWNHTLFESGASLEMTGLKSRVVPKFTHGNVIGNLKPKRPILMRNKQVFVVFYLMYAAQRKIER